MNPVGAVTRGVGTITPVISPGSVEGKALAASVVRTSAYTPAMLTSADSVTVAGLVSLMKKENPVTVYLDGKKVSDTLMTANSRRVNQ
jgi:hypothetical protein